MPRWRAWPGATARASRPPPRPTKPTWPWPCCPSRSRRVSTTPRLPDRDGPRPAPQPPRLPDPNDGPGLPGRAGRPRGVSLSGPGPPTGGPSDFPIVPTQRDRSSFRAAVDSARSNTPVRAERSESFARAPVRAQSGHFQARRVSAERGRARTPALEQRSFRRRRTASKTRGLGALSVLATWR